MGHLLAGIAGVSRHKFRSERANGHAVGFFIAQGGDKTVKPFEITLFHGCVHWGTSPARILPKLWLILDPPVRGCPAARAGALFSGLLLLRLLCGPLRLNFARKPCHGPIMFLQRVAEGVGVAVGIGHKIQV
ncbi:MAG: hypothetical protein BWY09_02034 [Candidatus Hydrogenedentes bacterium ADurb.Bin179]|nr:MAG: hypothetical protein BWY09_02034 [Candidatus Hydrogenedentes bacterium ADurb.Bin179]